MAEFTKGKWKIIQPSSGTLSILSAGDKPIALIQLRIPPYDDNFEQECNEMLANARLIAKAPEMYEALKEADKIICDLCQRVNNCRPELCKSCPDRKASSIIKLLAELESK